MEKLKKEFYTVQEYFDLEEKADEKSQYYKGDIFAMSGASINHNRITLNLASQLSSNLKGKPCEAFMSDMKIQIADLFTYPDVSVVCGEIDFYKNRTDTITNPKVIFEVLPESTKDYDRGTKFMLYRGMSSLTDYILVSQSEVRIEHFHKNEKGVWELTETISLDEILNLTSLKCELTVKEIYERVEWNKKSHFE